MHSSLLRYAWVIVLGAVGTTLAQSKDGPVVRSLRNSGQLGVGVEPKFNSKRDLLKLPAILAELKVGDDQKQALEQADQEVLVRGRRLAQEIQTTRDQLKQQGDPAAEEAYRQETLNFGKKLTQSFEKPLVQVLNRDQLKRLEQIQIRADGYKAFERPDVLDRLGLTPEQATAIDAITRAALKPVFAAAAISLPASTDFTTLSEEQKQALLKSKNHQAAVAQTQARVIDARAAVLREIRQVLTNAQQATFKNMAGEPFDFGKLNPIPAQEPDASPPSAAK